jgi:circadian clock protein KaiC
VRDLKPAAVVIDPISNFASAGEERDVHAMLVRLVDFLKMHGITTFFTNLTGGNMARESTDMGISSIMDTWILVRDIELGGERNRGIYVLKSRGTAHSNQIREFLITSRGLDLLDVYTGAEGVLTGSARLAQEQKERDEQMRRAHETQRKQSELERKRAALDTQVAALQAQYESEREELLREISSDRVREEAMAADRTAIGRSRKAAADGRAASGSAGGGKVGNGQRRSK